MALRKRAVARRDASSPPERRSLGRRLAAVIEGAWADAPALEAAPVPVRRPPPAVLLAHRERMPI